jgi:uncharacterized membrane protein YoaK (UPF0700 family)
MAWERRRALLLGLAGAAGTLDALTFVLLGKVFASFQSGNVLFLGIALGHGDGGLAVRAGVVLAGFVAGVAAGAHLIGARLSPRRVGTERQVIAIELVLLVAFAALWLGAGTPTGQSPERVALLAIGAVAMGIQGSLSMALAIPNVLTVAVTATVAALGQRLGLGRDAGDEHPSAPALAGVVGTYAVSALVVASLGDAWWLPLLPAAVLAAGVAADLHRLRRLATIRASAADSSRSSAAR